MRPIRADLWETSADHPHPNVTTHAYLWTGAPDGNVLFYGVRGDDDFDGIEALGGVAHQYLSHGSAAGPLPSRVHDHFGAHVHAPAAELHDVAVDVLVSRRHVDARGIEVIPTPGHTPGSTCYLVPGRNGQSYLFTGDTIVRGPDGAWMPGFVPTISEAEPLADSLAVLASLQPDLVISSSCPGDTAVHVAGRAQWSANVARARARLVRAA